MIDLSPINKYIDEPDAFMLRFIPNEIKSVGLEAFLRYNFHNLDCSRVSSDGLRLMQTIGLPYRYNITETVYVIKHYVDASKQDDYFNKLLELHENNLKYEQANPPIWYGTEKDKRKYKKQYESKSTKKQDVNALDKPKKVSAAEKKLAAKVAKINALSFKIKPQN